MAKWNQPLLSTIKEFIEFQKNLDCLLFLKAEYRSPILSQSVRNCHQEVHLQDRRQ